MRERNFQIMLNRFFKGEERELIRTYWKQTVITKPESDLLRHGYGSWLKYKHYDMFETFRANYIGVNYHIQDDYLYNEWVMKEIRKERVRKCKLIKKQRVA